MNEKPGKNGRYICKNKAINNHKKDIVAMTNPSKSDIIQIYQSYTKIRGRQKGDCMYEEKTLKINTNSITPLEGQTQIIMQRHCDYDRKNGTLIESSAKKQEKIACEFMQNMSKEKLSRTYFLFIASPTISSGDLKRCVETTKIAMNQINISQKEKGIKENHIINLEEELNYHKQIHQSKDIEEPRMLEDNTGYFEYLKEKHGGINKEFWIDFEEDLSKFKREQLNAEGPDQIVERVILHLQLLKRYASYFHTKKPNSQLIIWCGTHYDTISPFVRTQILNWDKKDWVDVAYCGGISLTINALEEIMVHLNGLSYPFDFPDKKQPLKHF